MGKKKNKKKLTNFKLAVSVKKILLVQTSCKQLSHSVSEVWSLMKIYKSRNNTYRRKKKKKRNGPKCVRDNRFQNLYKRKTRYKQENVFLKNFFLI